MFLNMSIEHYILGDVILQEGDLSNDKMYVIINGAVSIVIKDNNSKPSSRVSSSSLCK